MLMGALDGPPAPLLFIRVFIPLGMLILLHAWVSCGEPDNSQEAAALLTFKSTLSYVKAFDTWNPSVSPCSGDLGRWHGVLCFSGGLWGLQLENMGLSGQIDVDSLVPLRSLRTISLMNNSFGGPMPEWRKLGALKSIFLSNNQFSGQIPDDAFKGMGSLKKVYLANNKFTGHIPSSLATPRLLELKLENNGFTGPIPDIRPGLKVLNMSNNQLEGPIPQNLAFMHPSSFLGNKDLCGKPLEAQCNSLGPLPDEGPSPTGSADEPDAPSADHKKGPSVLRFIIIIIAGLVALVAILLILAIFRRSRKETPRLGRAISSTHKRNSSGSGLPGKGGAQVGMDPNAPPTMNSKKSHHEPSNKLSFVREDRQRFDLQDLLRASAEVLGSGNFGSAYKAVLMDGQAVVVKRFKQMNNTGKEDFHEHMRRLGRLSHPNLLPLVAYYYRKEEKLLVLDYVQNGSLARHLHGNHSTEQPALDWPTRLKIVQGVAKGLSYLHNELPSLSVPHGHLKSSNVVLDKTFQPLLMDYGLAPVVNQEQVQHLLVAYKSPECAKHGRTTRKTDVWNLGILILEILTSKFPANYLAQSTGYGSELTGWINSIAEEESTEVFDPEMGSTENSEAQMQKLLKIGVACCEEDSDKRWDLKEAVEKIEETKERDSDN